MRQILRRMEMIVFTTGWARASETRARLVDSLIRITCSLENNAFSVLHYVMVAVHFSMLHRFEIFSAPRTIAHGSIRLPPDRINRSLAVNDFIYFWGRRISGRPSNCQRGNRAKKRGWLGGRIIMPRNVGKNSQILRNPLKFAFLTIFGCK